MQTTAKEIEVTLAEVREKIALADALDQLHRSPAFKKVILKEYFDEKPKGLATVAAQVSTSENGKKVWENSLIGISALHGFFNAIYREGEQAKADLEAYEAEAAEVRADV